MKNFKKAISIFVTAMFILSLIPSSVMAGISYNTSSKSSALPWTGDDTPTAYMVNSDGTLPVLKDQAVTPTAMAALESVPGAYGKKATDEVYKSYDLPGLNTRTYTDGIGCYRVSGTNRKDAVLELSFSYEKAGNILPYSKYAEGILIESYIQYYSSYACVSGSRFRPRNSFAVKNNGILFDTKNHNDPTALDSEVTKFNFEKGKWYTLTMVFDLENKSAEADENSGSYTYKAYVNGKLISESTTATPYYGLRSIDLYPAVGAIINWDNISYYTIDDAATFVPQDAAPELEAADGSMTVDGDDIYFNEYVLTADEVKAAFAASLKENETIRIYNEDYTEELSGDAPAIDAKLVVAGSRNIQSETTPRETIYSYYDIGIDGYMFVEPQINITGAKATGSVTLYNSSEEEKAFKVYLAVYNGNELVAINASDNDLITTAETKVVNHVTPEVNIASGNKVKLLVWNADDLSPELSATEETYTISNEYNPKNADLASVVLPMAEYNDNYNQIANLYPAFDKDVTEYTVYSYTKGYAGNEIILETVNPDATVSLTSAPDTSLTKTSAIYTVTSADGSVTKDYTFNYVTGNEGGKRNIITSAVNIYTKSTGTCLAQWNSNDSQFASGTNLYLQDGIYVRSATDKRAIKTSNAIIEVDITNVPEDIAYGVLRLSLTNTFAQAKKSGTVRLYKVNDAVYTDGLSAITTSNIASYMGDELAKITVNAKIGNNADMYLVNIGDDYIEELKAAGKTKMYIAIAGVTNDSENGFSAIFAGKTGDSSKYTESLLDYVSAE